MADERTDARLTDRRLYRLAFVPALLALVAVMFSLEGMPEPVEPLSPTGIFGGEAAVSATREILRRAPERPPGSAGDAAAADLVRERFEDVPPGSVFEQRFEADVDGKSTELRNIVLTLPGDSDRAIAILARRDSERGTGAASSAASTGVLLELARTLGVAGHESAYLLVSSAGGPAGVRGFLDRLPEPAVIDAVITLSAMGTAEPRQPFAIATTTESESGPLQLLRTAESVIESQVGIAAERSTGFAELARLAFPSGLGPQATAIAAGFDSVGISAGGERPLTSGEDEGDDLSPRTVEEFGRAAHTFVGAVDLAPDLEHGPEAYLELAGNVVPGWAIAILALTLLVPALLAAIDGCARVSRRGGPLVHGVGWALARSLPFVGVFALLYALALAGLIPRPAFPFDPGLHPTGVRAAIAFLALAFALAISAWILRRSGAAAPRAPAGAVAPTGLVIVVAAIALWIANPYLALLAAPAAHVWLLADGLPSRRRAGLCAAAAFAAIVPVCLALASVAGALELGLDAPWTFTLMVADGQIGLGVILPSIFLAGGFCGAVALALSRGGILPAVPRPEPFAPDPLTELAE